MVIAANSQAQPGRGTVDTGRYRHAAERDQRRSRPSQRALNGRRQCTGCYTLLGGAHCQGQTDIDKDGWADLPGYKRGVIRPRLFWDNHAGRSVFATFGATVEHRTGGTIENATVPDGRPFPEAHYTGRQRLEDNPYRDQSTPTGYLVSSPSGASAACAFS